MNTTATLGYMNFPDIVDYFQEMQKECLDGFFYARRKEKWVIYNVTYFHVILYVHFSGNPHAQVPSRGMLISGCLWNLELPFS